MREIGSEFEEGSICSGINKFNLNLFVGYKKYVLSGRTGLDLIAKQLLEEGALTKIALPDYCCYSMIEPFIKNGFEINFYPISLKRESSQKNIEQEIEFIVKQSGTVLVMDYFGFIDSSNLKIVQVARNLGKKIIVDATQTAFSIVKTYEYADFLVISYRKWFDSTCAVVVSKQKMFCESKGRYNSEFYNTYKKASLMKREYIESQSGDKEEMLRTFARAKLMLAENYENCLAPKSEIDRLKNIDSNFLITRRRKNALMLIEYIKKSNIQDEIDLVFEELKDEDCPLFIPVLVKRKDRDKVRVSLTKKGVYCPVHWPIANIELQKYTRYHKNELSLICDQRYDCKDMEQQAKCLVEILSK